MKKVTKILLWGIVALLGIFSVVLIPSVASALFLATIMVILPIEKWQNHIKRFMPLKWIMDFADTGNGWYSKSQRGVTNGSKKRYDAEFKREIAQIYLDGRRTAPSLANERSATSTIQQQRQRKLVLNKRLVLDT